MFIYTLIERYLFPHGLSNYIQKYMHRTTNLYVQISIDEYSGDLVEQKNQPYKYAEAYISSKAVKDAMQLKAYTGKNSKNLLWLLLWLS
ncbi:hypothetical protein MKX01_020721 [Papaver californicum]|nr:hypothetical protein MKX01_020721 [Papaver californicum]